MTIMEDKNLNEVLTVKNSTKIVKPGDQSDIGPLKLKVYKRRWLMLAIYMFSHAACSCQWIEYSIIANVVARYYGVSLLTVDCTAILFMALYVTGILSYETDKYSLRWNIIISSGINCLGAWVKTYSVQPNMFHVVIIGQAIVAVAQTLILPMPGRLAAQWFPASELSKATSLGIFGNQFGIALSFLLTPIVVKNHESLDDVGKDLSRLCWGIAIITTIGFVLVLILFQDEPKLPPNKIRTLQKINQAKEEKEVEFDALIKRLCKNRSFVTLCNSHGLNVGVLNTIGTLLNQIFLMHFQNGEEDAGRIGLAIIISGMIGSVTFGIILDKTHKFKQTAVIVYFLTLCGQILFAVFTCMGIKWMVYVSSIFLGFFMNGYFSLGYDLCIEYTYPEPEDMSVAVLNITDNCYSIIFFIISGLLLKGYGDIPVHICLCSTLLFGFILTILTKDEQRRQDARKKVQYEGIAKTEKDNIDDISETNQLDSNIQ